MDATVIVIILAVLLALINGALIWYAIRLKDTGSKVDQSSVVLMQQQLQELARTVDSKIGESTKTMNESMRAQLGESSKMIREVTQRLTKLDETNRQVVSFADQLQHLQDILQNPKRRGVLGEYYLETVLKNVLPPAAYQMQYKVGKDESGADLIVDAAIFVQDKIIPIDSKFSLENYNRLAEERDESKRTEIERAFKQDLKNRIDETSKYIQPEMGTMDFALMFIPSEAIFYDLLINQVGAVKVSTEDLIQYAAKKRVNVVSPNSFYAFLQVILQGLNQMKIEKNTEEIRKRVGELGKHLTNYEEFVRKMGNSLSTTVNHYNTSYKELGKIDKDVMRITGENTGIEPELIDKPGSEED